jgi:four helix bundle protein
MKEDNKILHLGYEFSFLIIDLYKQLIQHSEYVISKQLLKCGTSIGANVEEANAAQSKKDFIAKMAIASKESRETRYWLKLLNESKLVDMEYDFYLGKVEHIINILTSIVKTSQQNI